MCKKLLYLVAVQLRMQHFDGNGEIAKNMFTEIDIGEFACTEQAHKAILCNLLPCKVCFIFVVPTILAILTVCHSVTRYFLFDDDGCVHAEIVL